MASDVRWLSATTLDAGRGRRGDAWSIYAAGLHLAWRRLDCRDTKPVAATVYHRPSQH
jgi:hypothetical protein